MMQAFRDYLDECDLVDLGFIGDQFTWRRGGKGIQECLDRAVCNEAWTNNLPLADLVNEQHVHSDHRLLMLDTE